MNSGRRERSKFAALDKSANRVDASVRLQIPLAKLSNDEAITDVTVSRLVDSIVAIMDSVAGLITSICTPDLVA